MIKVQDVNWFYIETEKTSKRLFQSFTQGKDIITPQTLKQHLNNLRIFPSHNEIQAMIHAALVANATQQLNYTVFRAIRTSQPKTRNYSLDINIYAEYTKFNCAYIHKGFITEDAIETALERDNMQDLVEYVTNNMSVLCFNDQYKLIGVKELYSFMKGEIPNQWRQWICDELHLEVAKEEIIAKLVSYGFLADQVKDLVDLLDNNGYISALPEYLDKCELKVVHYFV